MLSHSAITRNLNLDILILNPRARARTATLQLTEHIAGRRTTPVLQCDVADVEFARVALAAGVVVARALRDRKNARSVVELEVRHGDVGGVAETSAASVRGVAA